LVVRGDKVPVQVLISEDARTNQFDLTEQSEVVLAVVKLIKADIGFDGYSGPRVTEVGVVA